MGKLSIFSTFMPIVTLILGMSRNKWSQWKEKPNSNQPCVDCKEFHHHYITHFCIYTPKIRPKSLFLGPFSHLFEDLSYAKTGITQKVVGCMTKFLHQSCWDSAAEFQNSHHIYGSPQLHHSFFYSDSQSSLLL